MRQGRSHTDITARGIWRAVMILACVLGLNSTSQAAENEQCAPACRAKHNQCRIQMKGAPVCDTQLEACIRACVATQKSTVAPKS